MLSVRCRSAVPADIARCTGSVRSASFRDDRRQLTTSVDGVGVFVADYAAAASKGVFEEVAGPGASAPVAVRALARLWAEINV